MNSQSFFTLWARLQSDPSFLPHLLSRSLAPLEELYRFFLNRRRLSAIARQTSLPVPVVSVGNLTLGGTGKSVLVAWLVSALARRAIRAAVVSRGYRRRLTRPEIVASCDPLRYGDEPALFWSLGFSVAVGRDRYEAARLLLYASKPPPACIILDDGFQYWSLYRSVDIVLYDVSQGLWTHCLPRGPLREPLNALTRASAVVLSRAQDLSESILLNFEEVLRQYSFSGPFFRMDIIGVPESPPSEPALYVVGTGNPGSVFRSLRWNGRVIPLVFPDHEKYGPRSLAHIRRTVKANSVRSVLVTRKDLVKLQGYDPGAPLIPVNTRVAFHDEPAFLDWLFAQIPSLMNPATSASISVERK